MITVGDCVEAMAGMPPGSVDAIVTDPPYGLEFMGKDWDRLGATTLQDPSEVGGFQDGNGGNAYSRSRVRFGQDARSMQAWHEAWAREALRVLKPGGHLLAFGGTRTYHRLACAVEDAGFEIRDCLAWMYGSGFPKSLDVSKAIDKAAGAEREIVGPGRYAGRGGEQRGGLLEQRASSFCTDGDDIATAPATLEAQQWQGWGTALKPAHEPIVLARKPLTGTVAGNVQAHGTGALNVDGCRIGLADDEKPYQYPNGKGGDGGAVSFIPRNDFNDKPLSGHSAGRWPANVILDPDAAAMLDEQTGELTSGVDGGRPLPCSNTQANCYGHYKGERVGEDATYGDTGGASRFFYVPKASSAERHAGLDGPGIQFAHGDTLRKIENKAGAGNNHPTVKPIELMRWLVRLITPPGGLVLDPFTGSGTTGIAATLEHFQFLGIEREPEYARIAEARIAWWAAHPDGMDLVRRLELEREAATTRESGQLDLFGAS